MSLERTATIVSSFTAFLLLIIKFCVGIFSGSIAVLSSAIDSLLDFFVSLFNYFAIHNSEKPADKLFNYGRGKMEALASFIEGIIIYLSGTYILYESILKIIHNEQISYVSISIFVMLISLVITGGLVIFLESVAKKTNNLVIQADAVHYKTDLYSNGGIIIALLIIHFTGLYYIDAVIGMVIALYIIYSAFPLVKKGVLLLLDVSLNESEVKQITKIIEQENSISSYHFLRTRKAGKMKVVDVHLVFNKEIKLINAHSVGDRVEYKISQIDKKIKWIINIHLDPYDDSHNESH